MPAELYVKRSQRDVMQRLCHGFQRASASVDAEGDRTFLMPYGSLDQRILHICISYDINEYGEKFTSPRRKVTPTCPHRIGPYCGFSN